MMPERKVTVGYSASVKCDLPEPGPGKKSYEGATGHFTLTVTEDVEDGVDLFEYAEQKWEQYKIAVDKQTETFYKEVSKWAK